jgi:hypothetical protein
VTTPEPRQIIHPGDDRVEGIDFLPPLTASTIRVRTSPDNFPVDAILTGVNMFAVGEAEFIVGLSSVQGNEPLVGLLFYQQALDVATGLRRWRTFMIPACRCIPLPAGGTDQSTENQYAVSPIVGMAHLWGVPLTLAVEGSTQEQYLRGMCEGKPHVAAWGGDAVTVQFKFYTALPAFNKSKVAVFVNGVSVTPSVVTTTSFTLSVAPAAGAIVTCFYETT